MSVALNSYGQRCTMQRHMQESAPPQIVQMCLEAADGISLRDIGELLRHRCLHGCEPGTSKGPHSWGWFPTVIAVSYTHLDVYKRQHRGSAARLT